MERLNNMNLGKIMDLILKDIYLFDFSELGYLEVKRKRDIYKLFLEYPKIKVELIALNNLNYNTREVMLGTVNDYLKKNNLYATEVAYSPKVIFSR